jgi:putative FmdB family regulatory protein
MPIYEYTCSSYGAVSEILTNIGGHSDPLRCKKCGSADLDKLLSAPSIGNAVTSGSDCSTQEACYSPSCGTKPGSG